MDTEPDEIFYPNSTYCQKGKETSRQNNVVSDFGKIWLHGPMHNSNPNPTIKSWFNNVGYNLVTQFDIESVQVTYILKFGHTVISKSDIL